MKDADTIIMGIIIFVVLLGGSFLGMIYRSYVLQNKFNEQSSNFVLSIGLNLSGVVAALVLALAVTGAQNAFDNQRNELIDVSSEILLINQILIEFGPDSNNARTTLRDSLSSTIDKLWPSDNKVFKNHQTDIVKTKPLYQEILKLNPNNESQSLLRDKALDISYNLEKTRDLLIVQNIRYLPKTYFIVLILLVIWFLFIFFSLGIYAPINATVILALILSALSVAIAFFIIIDLNLPFDGLLRLPDNPLTGALNKIA